MCRMRGSCILPIRPSTPSRVNYHLVASGSSPTGVVFDLAGVNVVVCADPPTCDRVVGAAIPFFLIPIPIVMPFWYPGDRSSFVTLVTIKGERVSVDPAQVVLRDPTGRVVKGTV